VGGGVVVCRAPDLGLHLKVRRSTPTSGDGEATRMGGVALADTGHGGGGASARVEVAATHAR
jgi:hypothetical protein